MHAIEAACQLKSSASSSGVLAGRELLLMHALTGSMFGRHCTLVFQAACPVFGCCAPQLCCRAGMELFRCVSHVPA